MTLWERSSALQTNRIESDGLCICALPFRSKLLLQARGDIDFIRQASSRVVGQDLPIIPNTSTNSGNTVLWLGPRKWLIIMDPRDLREIKLQLERALVGIPHLLSDLSDARTGIEVSGLQAGALLARVCALDLDSGSFGPGRCAQSQLVRVPLLLYQADEQPVFHLYVDRSLARYAWDWLSDGAKEFTGDDAPA